MPGRAHGVARALRVAVLALSLPLAAVGEAGAATILFDASKRPMAGNADWIIDADAWNLNLPAYPCSGSTNESNPARFPTPPASGIGPSTPETYWTGGISAWAVDLVKAGHTVETLPPGAAITFGDAGNPQDLGLYQMFILVEPQNPFTAAEKSAILDFVAAGGGLFMVADHETSDRDCDGWDSPRVLNDLTGASSAASAGLFGIWFRVNGLEDRGSDDWFDDGIDANVATNPVDPIIYGPFGSGAGGLGLFGSTSMELNPSDNATVAGHVWRTGQAHGTTRVTFATASFGSGRVAAIGDSSPADDDTGDPSDSLYPGWDKASGGVKNREIHLNACAWLLNPAPDTTAPSITSTPVASASDCSARITWTTDEGASSVVDYGVDTGYGSQASTPGFVQSHSVALSPLAPSTEYHFRVASTDVHGNGPTLGNDATFTTAGAAAPAIVSGPSVTAISGSSATIAWTTDEPASSMVEYGATAGYGETASGASDVTQHTVVITGLSPTTEYHYRVLSSDACGNGPIASSDATFTTTVASIDVSGWTIKQLASALTYAIPAGTMLPAGGYLVVGRHATRAEFQGFHPGLPAAAVYLNSNQNGSCASAGCFPQINGDEMFELYDAGNVKVDGATIAMTTTHAAYQRINPSDPAGAPGSWNIVAESAANPGLGAGAASGASVRINEMSDASDFTKEFVELHYDAAPASPDVVAPAGISDLLATPLSASTIRLTWTAVGDDGMTGTASTYDARISAHRFVTAADFAAATPLTGEPAPTASGSAQQFVLPGLNADTAYFFAMKVADDAANVSPLSNSTAAVTAPPGGGPTVSHLVISQIRIAGSNDDVVEIYNPTAAAIALAGHSIQYLAGNGNFGFRVNLTAANSVPARGWYLAAANGYAGTPSRDESLGANNASSSAGHLLLVSKTTNVTGCADAAIVDKVGYGGTASCAEGTAASAPGAGLSIARKPGGSVGNGQDTDVNSADFLAPAAPAFHNQLDPPASPPAVLGNVRNTLFLERDPGGTRLEWGTAAGATGYRIYRGTVPGFMSEAPAPWLAPTASPAYDPSLPSPIWYYLIRATDGINESTD